MRRIVVRAHALVRPSSRRPLATLIALLGVAAGGLGGCTITRPVDGPEPADCILDRACGDAAYCGDDGLCYPEAGCTRDDECGPGQVCTDAARCHDPGGCAFDAHCDSGLFCDAGACEPIPLGMCRDGHDCPAGQRCGAEAVCVVIPVCLRDADCGAGLICRDDGRCGAPA